MAEPIEKREAPVRGIDHRAEALALLGDHRPPAGTAEAIAEAQVHALVAMTDAQTEIARLLSAASSELNTANMFRLAETLPQENPLRSAIIDGLLGHVTRNGPLRTDVMLAVRIRDLGLEIKTGDDIVVGNQAGTKSITLVVIDLDNDVWLHLNGAEGEVDPIVDTPRIQALFDEEIRSLTVTLKENPPS